MLDFYFSGVFVAFVINLPQIGISVTTLLSLRAKNLRKVGLYYSCIRGKFTASSFSWLKFSMYLVYMLAISPLFSWLSVASAAIGVLYWLVNKTPTPERVKEIQYKFANVDLPKEQVVSLLQEIGKILGVEVPSSFGSDSDDEDGNKLIIENTDWYCDVSVDTAHKKFSFYSHSPDYDSIGRSTYEYRFENDKLLSRLIEDSVEHYGKVEYCVKDNVVLESEMREREEQSKVPMRRTLDSKIVDLRKSVEWNEFKRYDVRYFVMSKHREIFPELTFRKIVRQDLERIRNGAKRVLEEAGRLRAVVNETDTGFDVQYPENCSESEREVVEKLFDDKSLTAFGITWDDLRVKKQYENDLLKLLGETGA